MKRPTGNTKARTLRDPSQLTPGEQQAMDLAQQGKSHAEIAAELGLSVYTVRNQIKTATEKRRASGALRGAVA